MPHAGYLLSENNQIQSKTYNDKTSHLSLKYYWWNASFFKVNVGSSNNADKSIPAEKIIANWSEIELNEPSSSLLSAGRGSPASADSVGKISTKSTYVLVTTPAAFPGALICKY